MTDQMSQTIAAGIRLLVALLSFVNYSKFKSFMKRFFCSLQSTLRQATVHYEKTWVGKSPKKEF